MKSSAVLAKSPEPSITYPVLARIRESFDNKESFGTIVLFNSVDKGMVVYVPANRPRYKVGQFDYWVSVTDKECWEVLPAGDRVTLEQE